MLAPAAMNRRSADLGVRRLLEVADRPSPDIHHVDSVAAKWPVTPREQPKGRRTQQVHLSRRPRSGEGPDAQSR
jgi:hypothetical protein